MLRKQTYETPFWKHQLGISADRWYCRKYMWKNGAFWLYCTTKTDELLTGLILFHVLTADQTESHERCGKILRANIRKVFIKSSEFRTRKSAVVMLIYLSKDGKNSFVKEHQHDCYNINESTSSDIEWKSILPTFPRIYKSRAVAADTVSLRKWKSKWQPDISNLELFSSFICKFFSIRISRSRLSDNGVCRLHKDTYGR